MINPKVVCRIFRKTNNYTQTAHLLNISYRTVHDIIRMSQHKCIECNSPAVVGRRKCKYHLQIDAQESKEKRKYRIEQNLCFVCGKKSLPNKVRCAECSKKSNEQSLQRYHKLSAKERYKLRQARNDIERFGGNRLKTLQRDNFQCQICHTTKSLLVHHIDNTGKDVIKTGNPNNDLSNLITLCKICHVTIQRLLKNPSAIPRLFPFLNLQKDRF